MDMKCESYLALADGAVFPGRSCGAACDLPGEAVFNTGMTGYQEIASDPSYYGQIVALSASEIGNYGCNPEDMESAGLHLNGLLVQQLNPPSSWRSTVALDEMFRQAGKPILAGVDTRRLVLHLRENGTQKAWIHADGTELPVEEAIEKARRWKGLDMLDCAAKVSCQDAYCWSEQGTRTVVVLDCGVKFGILRQLAQLGLKVKVVPSNYSAEKILAMKPAGVLLSNGPGDPAGVKGAIECVKGLLGKVPIMGICLGHQILGLACGGRTARLHFGHHGCNHPVQNLLDGTVEITSQNHNFAICPEGLPDCLEVTHINLNDRTIEGVRHKELPAFSVQYHPEASPGPWDARTHFAGFLKMMDGGLA